MKNCVDKYDENSNYKMFSLNMVYMPELLLLIKKNKIAGMIYIYLVSNINKDNLVFAADTELEFNLNIDNAALKKAINFLKKYRYLAIVGTRDDENVYEINKRMIAIPGNEFNVNIMDSEITIDSNALFANNVPFELITEENLEKH